MRVPTVITVLNVLFSVSSVTTDISQTKGCGVRAPKYLTLKEQTIGKRFCEKKPISERPRKRIFNTVFVRVTERRRLYNIILF